MKTDTACDTVSIRMREKIKSNLGRVTQYEKMRFAFVGVINTAVDFGILFSLVNLAKMPSVTANVISTTAALIVSYSLNKRSVFANTDAHNPRQIILFVVVTLSGLWLLQNAVIFIVSGWLDVFLAKNITLFTAKVLASLFSLTWNYLWYSRIIFKRKSL